MSRLMAARASLAEQSAAAVSAVPGGVLKLVVNPPSPDRATVFIVDADNTNLVVSVDPHGPRVIDTIVKDDTWFYWANNIHGTLLIGTLGDRIVEIVAGLGVILVLTGLYMWWPRNGRTFARALLPNLRARGRAIWKELHVSFGFYMSVVLLFFLISGLSWAGIWGERIMQAWSTFPAEKWDNVPLSDKTHASMNHGALKEVPWALEQTPMPASGSAAGATGLADGTPVTLDTVAAFARSIGFDGQFRINVPQGDDGVFTVSADSMDGDTTNVNGDRTVHIDQYTGKILADVALCGLFPAGQGDGGRHRVAPGQPRAAQYRAQPAVLRLHPLHVRLGCRDVVETTPGRPSRRAALPAQLQGAGGNSCDCRGGLRGVSADRNGSCPVCDHRLPAAQADEGGRRRKRTLSERFRRGGRAAPTAARPPPGPCRSSTGVRRRCRVSGPVRRCARHP